MLPSNVRSHIAALVAFEAAMSSASAVDNATVGWRFEDHETVPLATSKMKPLVEHRISSLSAQSASDQPMRSSVRSEPPKVSP